MILLLQTQKVVDFDKLSEYDDVFKGLDVVYCCLGTTRGKSGAVSFVSSFWLQSAFIKLSISLVKDGFRKVDYDYIVGSAQVAKKNGCKHFHLVSSAGADKNAYLLYPKVKGESEEAISQMGFERASIYRPK